MNKDREMCEDFVEANLLNLIGFVIGVIAILSMFFDDIPAVAKFFD